MNEWSTEEKQKILKILQKYGGSNYDTIHRYMPEKTVEEIRTFCEFKIQKATEKWDRTKANKDSDAAIRDWIHVLKSVDDTQTGHLTDIIPRVLKYIALFENTNKNSCINLNDCYMVLSQISSGYAPKQVDDSNLYFLYECLLQLATTLKSSGAKSSLKYLKYLTILKAFMDKNGIQRPQSKSDCTSILNPLSVPADMLKVSEFEKNVSVFE